jgi:hypothetical protein
MLIYTKFIIYLYSWISSNALQSEIAEGFGVRVVSRVTSRSKSFLQGTKQGLQQPFRQS